MKLKMTRLFWWLVRALASIPIAGYDDKASATPLSTHNTNGLPMVGGVDVAGNPFGTNGVTRWEW